MRTLVEVHHSVKRLPVLLLIPLTLAMTFAILVPFLFVPYVFGSVGQPYEDRSFVYMAFFGCIIAPVVETAVFQALPIQLVRSCTGLSSVWAVMLSAFLFGLGHGFNVTYIIASTLVGLVLAYAYFVCLDSGKPAFWIVSVVHALRNLISLLALHA